MVCWPASHLSLLRPLNKACPSSIAPEMVSSSLMPMIRAATTLIYVPFTNTLAMLLTVSACPMRAPSVQLERNFWPNSMICLANLLIQEITLTPSLEVVKNTCDPFRKPAARPKPTQGDHTDIQVTRTREAPHYPDLHQGIQRGVHTPRSATTLLTPRVMRIRRQKRAVIRRNKRYSSISAVHSRNTTPEGTAR